MERSADIACWGNGSFPELTWMHEVKKVYRVAPERRFMASLDDSISYARAYHDINALAWYFSESCGLTSSSTVVLSTPNLLLAPIVMAAVQLCGARLVMLSCGLKRPEFEHAANLVKPDVIVVSLPDACEMAREIVPDAVTLALGCPNAPVPLVEDVIKQAGFDESRAFPYCTPDNQIVVFSSGSTGRPKAIVNKASSFVLNGRALRKSLSLTGDDVIFVPVPLNHVFGVVGVSATLVAGATLVTGIRYRTAEACLIIDSLQATVHLGVPTMFVRELHELDARNWDFSSLRAGLVAGAGCPSYVIPEFERRTGCKIMQSYGMSETSATLTVTPLELSAEARARTVGHCIEGSQAKVLPETGELVCKSASMMLGVLQDDGTLRLDLDEDGWFHSGDVARIDEDGMISIVGRIKDMIIRGGINIFPMEIESVYEDNDAVASCCVVSCPDDDLGERTCLCVTLAPCAEAVTAHELRMWAKGRIEKCKIPDYVVKMDAFPYLGSNKIDKTQLREQVISRINDLRSGNSGA